MRARSVAIVGRPNVGKSALFNRLAGKKISIVHDQAGVTRDRVIAECRLGKQPFTLVDTGGIGAVADADFSEQVRLEADIAMQTAGLILFVVDAKDGRTPVDETLARQLRRAQKPLILVVNKIDDEKHRAREADFTRLGFEKMLAVSAEHGRGIDELVEQIESLLPADEETRESASQEASRPLRIAIVGRPNVGKSSLINAILQDRRTLVSEISGTTRDAVDVPYSRDEKSYVLIDTAGIRPRGKVSTSVEVFSVMRSEKSIARADLCVLVIDATTKVTAQDKKIAGMIQKEQKPCVLAVNKWDLVFDDDAEKNPREKSAREKNASRAKNSKAANDKAREFLHEFVDDIRAELFFVDYAPVVMLSAKTGRNMDRLFRVIEQIREDAHRRITTGQLNRLIQQILSANPPPIRSGHRFKVLYATQIEPTRDAPISIPKFLFFVNDPGALTPAYRKHLDAQLRKEQRYLGLPILLQLRGRKEKE